MATDGFDITNIPTQIDSGLTQGTVYRFRVTQLNTTNNSERVKVSTIAGSAAPAVTTDDHDTYGLYDGFWLKPILNETIWAWTDYEDVVGRVIYHEAI